LRAKFFPCPVTHRRAVSSEGRETKSELRKVMVMRIFVAGGAGVLGRRLIPQLVVRDHEVTATTRSSGKLSFLEQLGATGVVMDGR